MAIRLVRLYTGDDGESHFTDGQVELEPPDSPNARSAVDGAATVTFEESAPGSTLSWHNAPERQYVITLLGTLEFETRLGERFTVAPGVVLLAEDTTGGGHRWRLVDDQPWRRVYVTLR
jgi:quercetin dioxygenase-like cupin family protein